MRNSGSPSTSAGAPGNSVATKVARLLAGGSPDESLGPEEAEDKDGGGDTSLIDSLKAAWESGDSQAIYDAITALHDDLHKDMGY
jgi:hypothetical protein